MGLSDKEIDVYFVVLEHGEATVTEITEAVDISTRYVYDITEQLADRDIVVLNDYENPTTIRAIDPEKAIGNLMDELETVESELEQLFTAPEPSDIEFDVIRSDQTARRQIKKIIDETTDEIVLSIPGSRYSGFADEIENAANRGVSVLLLVEKNRATPPLDELDIPHTVVRVLDTPLPLMVGADVEVGMLGPTGSFTGADGGRDIVTVRQPQLVGTIVGSCLSNYWPVGEEVYVAKPGPLPETYGHFRSAVLEATLHQRRGHELSATAEVTPLTRESSTDVRTISGEIVEIRQGLVNPSTNTFPLEASLTLDTDDGRYSVGGQGSLMEDFEAKRVTLER
ncbi:TrmB family transcriptional regulator sugar-binding domain-containing protein [Halomicrococcus sp. SG-WS-1]|uniref:TrmB family transcriptional regulator sugar-binding domain-containing protein n=1 Tax=Halomicrococcus sp. SG-WS-1 TaxID=3439057 RepID=UPI003F7AF9CD